MKITQGFTLIELLLAASIISVISVLSINLLWDTVTSRSKNYSIERSTDNFREFTQDISRFIQEAKSLEVVANDTLLIGGEICRTFRFNLGQKTIESAIDSSANCTPPLINFAPVIEGNIEIASFEFSPTGVNPSQVNISIEGNYQDSLGTHPIKYDTTVYPRVSL